MKKKYISAFLFACSALLTVAFAVRLYFDYTRHYTFGSAPFGLYIAERFIEYMILAIVCLIAGMVVKKRLTV